MIDMSLKNNHYELHKYPYFVGELTILNVKHLTKYRQYSGKVGQCSVKVGQNQQKALPLKRKLSLGPFLSRYSLVSIQVLMCDKLLHGIALKYPEIAASCSPHPVLYTELAE